MADILTIDRRGLVFQDRDPISTPPFDVDVLAYLGHGICLAGEANTGKVIRSTVPVAFSIIEDNLAGVKYE